MHILCTGGLGFIASHFVRYVLETYPDDQVTVLDRLTYAGDLRRLSDLDGHPRLRLVLGDLADEELMKSVLGPLKIDAVVNAAAESHVDRSISAAAPFIHANVKGVQVLLDGMLCQQERGRKLRLCHMSTDEVYSSLESGFATEDYPLCPTNIYSACKASAEHLIRAYNHTFGLDTVVTRGANTMGPWQHGEKLIPTLVRHALDGQPLPIYGDGRQVRTWMYVMDHVRGVDRVLRLGKSGQAYNLGTPYLQENVEVAKDVLRLLDLPLDQIAFVLDRKGHDQRYAIDSTKVAQLGWEPLHSYECMLKATVTWYQEHPEFLAPRPKFVQ